MKKNNDPKYDNVLKMHFVGVSSEKKEGAGSFYVSTVTCLNF